MKLKKSLLILFSCVLLLIPLFHAHAQEAIRSDTNTDSYFYNQLSSAEQALYNRFRNMPADLCIRVAKEEYSSLDAFIAAAVRAYSAMVADHPRVRMMYERYPGSYFETEDAYCVSAEKCISFSAYQMEKCEFKINDIVNRVISQRDRYSQVRALAVIMWMETRYDTAAVVAAGVSQRTLDLADCATGVFSYGSAVCAGFADATKILCDELGIPCLIVGNAGHAWNYIQMENGRWYALDLSANASGYEENHILYGSKDYGYANETSYHLSELYIKFIV